MLYWRVDGMSTIRREGDRENPINTIDMSFVEIERMLSAPLPASASKQAWWGNDPTYTQARAWGNARFAA